MAEAQEQTVSCPIVVLSLRAAQVNSDTVAETLRDELLSLYLRSSAVHAVLDFAKVTYLSSAGFRPLLSLNRHVRQRGGLLVLCNLRPQVEEVFSVTRLIDPTGMIPCAFAVQPTVAAAVTHVCGLDSSP